MAGRPVVRYRTTRHTVEFINASGAVHLALQRTGVTAMRSPVERGVILVSMSNVADVFADLESQGRRLELVGEVLG